MIIEQLLLIANVIIALANLFFIYFYFMQLREAKKAIIVTKFTGAEKDSGSKQAMVESLPQYLYVENISKNKISSLQVIYTFQFDNKNLITKKTINYLNPHERAKILIRLGDLIDKYPELFEQYKRSGDLLKIPKETLKIKLRVLFKWKIFNRQEDEYFIEWLSKKNCPDLKYHPKINSWNRRNDIDMEKIR